GAARMGAGLVTVACPAGVSAILEIKTTEAMTVPIPDTEENCLAASSAAMLIGLAHERDVVVMGPGIGKLEETAGLMRELGKLIERPLVLDADGLNAFSTQPGLTKILAAREAPTVLTPHPGEAARLLGVSSSDINRDRIGAARKLCEATGSVVLLKGACSVIAAPDGRIAINPNGGPNLSSGGTGDVLAGMVGALLGQGLDAWNAATLAAWIHGATADSLSQQTGPSGMLASELADALPACCEEIRRGSDPDQPEAPQREREFSFLLPFPGA
ncbi:MAG: NAD(P)H-hydrate dehydratase, partial [Myxococcales bacterium]